MTLGHNGAYFPSSSENLIKFRFTEHDWRHVSQSTFTSLRDPEIMPPTHPEDYKFSYNYDNLSGGEDMVSIGLVIMERMRN